MRGIPLDRSVEPEHVPHEDPGVRRGRRQPGGQRGGGGRERAADFAHKGTGGRRYDVAEALSADNFLIICRSKGEWVGNEGSSGLGFNVGPADVAVAA